MLYSLPIHGDNFISVYKALPYTFYGWLVWLNSTYECTIIYLTFPNGWACGLFPWFCCSSKHCHKYLCLFILLHMDKFVSRIKFQKWNWWVKGIHICNFERFLIVEVTPFIFHPVVYESASFSTHSLKLCSQNFKKYCYWFYRGREEGHRGRNINEKMEHQSAASALPQLGIPFGARDDTSLTEPIWVVKKIRQCGFNFHLY